MFQLRIVRERRQGYGAVRSIRDASDVYAAFKDEFGRLDREMFVVLVLNGRNQVCGFNVVSLGSLNAALVHPREVFKSAILANAAAIILVHNHPSGDPEPSAEDRALTVRLERAGELLGIRVVDHIVVGDGAYRSMRERWGS